ncbi:MAG: tetratricopeptide repeat protein [Wenzhouxiangella sp.]
MSIFSVVALLAVLAALAFATIPLIVGGGRRAVAVVAGLVIFVPALTLGIYQQVGTPEAIDGDFGEAGETRSSLIELARTVERNPDDAENWIRMGLAYKQMEEFSSAEHALRRALFIDEKNPFIQVELAETLLYASGQPHLPAEGRRLLEQAVAREPDNQKGLWLLGLNAFQLGRHDEAAEWFERLVAVLPQGDVRRTVEQHLERARASAGGGLQPRPPEADSRDRSEQSASINVSVRLDEALAGQVSGDEVVYIIVRDGSNGGPPLAVQRISAADLPTSIVIDDSNTMLEGGSLGDAGSVSVVARISRNGQPTASEGDLEGKSEPIELSGETSVDVEINRVL